MVDLTTSKYKVPTAKAHEQRQKATEKTVFSLYLKGLKARENESLVTKWEETPRTLVSPNTTSFKIRKCQLKTSPPLLAKEELQAGP